MKTLRWIIKNIHLLIATPIVLWVAFIYASPELISTYFDIHIETTDHANMSKATAGLYLGCAAVWINGIFRPQHHLLATRLCALFMLTLALGRTLSWFTDGTPTFGFQFGTFAEAFLGLYALSRSQLFLSKT